MKQENINNYSDEAKRLVELILNELEKQGLSDLPYQKEILFAEIHGFPNLSSEDAEINENGPMRKFISSTLVERLTEQGISVHLLTNSYSEKSEVEPGKNLGIRVFQAVEEGSYGPDYQKNTFSYQRSKIQIYFTRNTFEY